MQTLRITNLVPALLLSVTFIGGALYASSSQAYVSIYYGSPGFGIGYRDYGYYGGYHRGFDRGFYGGHFNYHRPHHFSRHRSYYGPRYYPRFRRFAHPHRYHRHHRFHRHRRHYHD